MSEFGDHLDLGSEGASKKIPRGAIVAIVVFLALAAAAFFVTREKKNDQARREVLAILDKELTTDEEAVKAQRDKVQDLTKNLEDLRTKIQLGYFKDGKAAVVQFNKLAAEQRTERDKFQQIAEQYNQKVAKYRQIEK